MRRRNARASRRQAAPEPTSTLVDGTLRWLKLDENVRGMRAMRAFAQAAGPQILRRARAERLRGRTLFVRVATAAWSQELQLISSAIVERMGRILGPNMVDTLRFQVGDVEAIPEWAASPPRPAPPPPRPAPSEPVSHALHEALAAIPDPELRLKLADLVARAPRR